MSLPGAPAQPTLFVTGGPRDGDALVLESPSVEKTIGSSSGVHWRIEAGNVDAMHARVAWEETRVVLTDQGSSTGTYVNGERVAGEHVLGDGDRISLGPPGAPNSVRLLVRMPADLATIALEAPLKLAPDEDATFFEDDAPPPPADLAADPESEPLEPLVLDDLEPEPKAIAVHQPVVLPPADPPKAPAAAIPAIILDGDTRAAGARSPASPPPPRAAGPSPYQTDVSIESDRVRGPLEVPTAAAPVRPAVRPRGQPAGRKGGVGLRRRTLLLGVGAAILTAGGFFAYSRLHRPPPVLSGLTPLKAEPGATVTITGVGFGSGPVTVKFGDQAVSAVASDAEVKAAVPPALAPRGPAEVPVIVERGGAPSNALFLKVARIPRVARLEPDVALPGSEVVIRGQNLDLPGLTVKVAGFKADIRAAQADAVRIAVPDIPFTEGQAMPLTVEAGGDGARPATLLLGRLPLVSEVSPSAGDSGQRLTLKGRGFDPDPAANRVSVGGQPALVLGVTDTELQVAVPAPPDGAPSGPVPVVVEARGGTSSSAAGFTFTRSTTPLLRVRFFPAIVPGAPVDRHVFVSTQLGPVLLLSGKADAPTVAERAARVGAALSALADAGQPVTFEVRDGATPAVAANGQVVVTATPEDSDGYAKPWDTGSRPTRTPPRQIATYWAALLQDYLTLFTQGQRPTRTAELSARAKVLLDLQAESERRGAVGGVPAPLVSGLTPLEVKGIRDLALLLPTGAAPPAGVAVTGRWEGTMDDAGTNRSISLDLRVEGRSLAGSLITKTGALSVDIPLQKVTYDKGLLKFTAALGPTSRQFQARLEGSTLAGDIKDAAGKQAVGRFSVRHVE